VLAGLGEGGKGQIEIARSDRFFCVTGAPVEGGAVDVADGHHFLRILHEAVVKRAAAAAAPGRPQPREELLGLPPVEKLAKQLAAMGLTVVPRSDGYAACCPVHNDHNPSMTIRADEHGRLLVHCHGCGAAFGDIMVAAGLLPSDVHPDRLAAARARSSTRVRVIRPAGVPDVAPPELIERMTEEAFEYMEAIGRRSEKLAALAALLGVAEAALDRIDVGWKESNWHKGEDGAWIDVGGAWTFPEVDGKYDIVGIQRRFEDASIGKRAVGGGRRGLIVPDEWESLEGPVFIVEGESDVAALLTLGLCALGRPGAGLGARDLSRLLRREANQIADHRIIVLGENDAKPNGRWPEKEGAEKVAAELRSGLSREVEVFFPPAAVKDVREWVRLLRGQVKED
jgi:hypothetical protein